MPNPAVPIARRRANAGHAFTLIELIVVIVIMGILVAVGAFAYNAVIDNSRKMGGRSTAEQVAKTVQGLSASKASSAAELKGSLDAQLAGDIPAGAGVTWAEPADGALSGQVVKDGYCTPVSFDARVGSKATLGPTVKASSCLPGTSPGAGSEPASACAGFDDVRNITSLSAPITKTASERLLTDANNDQFYFVGYKDTRTTSAYFTEGPADKSFPALSLLLCAEAGDSDRFPKGSLLRVMVPNGEKTLISPTTGAQLKGMLAYDIHSVPGAQADYMKFWGVTAVSYKWGFSTLTNGGSTVLTTAQVTECPKGIDPTDATYKVFRCSP
jgi:prepilin-type N-terminal cleavage/methylation domain-containing protein